MCRTVCPPTAFGGTGRERGRQPALAREIGFIPRGSTASIALVVKNWTGIAGFDAAAFASHSLRRGAISSGVAQGIHITASNSSAAMPPLKSLEEYVELDELRQNHPLKDVL
jgi:hypothetical protein